MNKFIIPIVAVSIFVIGLFVYNFRDFLRKPTYDPSNLPKATNSSTREQNKTKDVPKVAVFAENLEIPWEIVFLPDKSALVAERPGRIRKISAGGNLLEKPVYILDDVKHIGEGGLLGMTLHPNFEENNFVYIYYTYHGEDAGTLNKVVRLKYDGNSFVDKKVVVENIPGAANHNGGRIKFGPDGYLYVATGDSQNQSLAQDRNSLAGKVLRMKDDGAPVPDNPFGNLIYSYGHRNPQGLAWDASGQLWETEHGPSSGVFPNCCQDEVNRIEKGANYGWPDSVGDKVLKGTIAPVVHSGRGTWAPSGMAYLDDSFYFSGLRSNLLIQVKISGDKLELIEHLKGEFGRLRNVVVGPDGLLYVLTSNRDGRGRTAAGDDKIIVVNPSKL